MAIQQRLDTLYLCWLLKPKTERSLYRLVRRHRVRTIVELGLDSIDRCQRLVRLARRCSPGAEIRYSGIDQFDARPTGQPRLTLKQTHKLLSGSGARVRLIPGDTFSALALHANQLQGTELLLISPNQDPQQLANAWMYVPRMLSDDAIVLQGTCGESGIEFASVSRREVQARAGAKSRSRQAA